MYVRHLPPFDEVDPSSPAASFWEDGENSDWVTVTPISRPSLHDIPMFPIHDFKRSSSRLLNSVLSSLKSVPGSATWPMTSASVGVSTQAFDRRARFRVKAHDLCDLWFALPGTGGSVHSLEWRRDTSGVSHESIVLQVCSNPESKSDDVWWAALTPSLAYLTEGDFATLSRDRSQVTRPGSEIRAEMSYPEGLSFGHILRILSIIHEVSPNYFIIGANCWFYASVIVEMLDPELGLTRKSSVTWIQGKNLRFCDHRTTKEINYHQYTAITNRVRELSQASPKPKTSSWVAIMMI
ncbi:hypothetical protein BDV93DRAFT_553039 [Ceratobasidium sp. AG-I]|nr:hypothetical protein BDV93DRAFT_553039 [Ceratobasidium sp. AG-I]